MDQVKIEIVGTITEESAYEYDFGLYKRVLGIGWNRTSSLTGQDDNTFAEAGGLSTQLATDFPNNES